MGSAQGLHSAQLYPFSEGFGRCGIRNRSGRTSTFRKSGKVRGRLEEREGDGLHPVTLNARGSAPRAKDRDLWLRPAQRGSGRVLVDPSRACSADRPTRPAAHGRRNGMPLT